MKDFYLVTASVSGTLAFINAAQGDTFWVIMHLINMVLMTGLWRKET